MKRPLRTSILFVVACGVLMAGCARRSTETPPAPPSAPPAAPSETPAAPAAPSTPAPAPPSAAEVVGQLQPAFFDYDSYSLNERARLALDGDARVLREHASVAIVIEGHCDERGTAEYNQALGERRAVAAREYLMAAGIDGSRLSVVSYGKERPFAAGSDEASWAQNRRAHFAGR